MEAKLSLLLLVALAVFAEIFATSVSLSDKPVAFEVGTAVSMSLIILYDPAIAAISAAVCSLGIWLYQPGSSSPSKNKKSWEQLSFNAGMHSSAIFVAGLVYSRLPGVMGLESVWGQVIAWLLAAITYDRLNFWLLMGIVRLKNGTAVKPLVIWRENLWAAPINIFVLFIGGGMLTFAASQLGVMGIVVFFLPIVLSAYAFHLYVKKMQAHTENLENIVAERTQALQKALEEKDAFLAVLTHDMKSPLTSIHLNASMIKAYPHILEKKPHMIDAVLHSQETLTGIVNNILDLEKIQATGELPLEKEVFELSALATNVFHVVQAQAEAKQIHFQLIGAERQIVVLADRRYMERVLHNLLNNAIKYTPPQGSVTAILSTKGRALFLQVQDSGYGIPAEEIPFVFDNFHRVSVHKKLAVGTGLGLAITKALVEAHDGRIEVMSEEGKGSLFTAHLPIVQQPVAELAEHKNGYQGNGRSQPKPVITAKPTFISY
ncbi:MAG: HAMP domain-containing histidine kinase [Anaerolineales bacterium]|nr:HAMP domain-containing histidine kinase [Anaerolineales bacterium]